MDEDLKKLIERTATETRRQLEAMATRLETKIVSDARTERLEVSVKEAFADIKAMIKFSHHDLDRRLRMLEETQNKLESVLEDLEARVSRLEDAPH